MKFSFQRVVLGSLAGALLLATSVVAQTTGSVPSATTDGSPAMAAAPNNPPAKAAPAPAAQTSVSTVNGKKISDDKDANVDLAAPATTPAPAANQADPLKRELSPEQKKQNAKKLKQELGASYKKWLNEDVRWIISPEELTAFKALSNDEERDNFIEQFWQRRDPTPDTLENEFKEEHYRRIAYANEHFAAGIPGWKTDRGQM